MTTEREAALWAEALRTIALATVQARGGTRDGQPTRESLEQLLAQTELALSTLAMYGAVPPPPTRHPLDQEPTCLASAPAELPPAAATPLGPTPSGGTAST